MQRRVDLGRGLQGLPAGHGVTLRLRP